LVPLCFELSEKSFGPAGALIFKMPSKTIRAKTFSGHLSVFANAHLKKYQHQWGPCKNLFKKAGISNLIPSAIYSIR